MRESQHVSDDFRRDKKQIQFFKEPKEYLGRKSVLYQTIKTKERPQHSCNLCPLGPPQSQTKMPILLDSAWGRPITQILPIPTLWSGFRGPLLKWRVNVHANYISWRNIVLFKNWQKVTVRCVFMCLRGCMLSVWCSCELLTMLQTIIIGIIPHRICTREAIVCHCNLNQPLHAL